MAKKIETKAKPAPAPVTPKASETAVRRPIKPKPRQGYNYARDANTSSGGLPGDYTFKPNVKNTTSLVMPKFSSAGCIVFRAFPMLGFDEETGKQLDEFEPFLWEARTNHFGDWIRQHAGVNYTGLNPDFKLSCLLYKVAHDPTVRSSNPYVVLYNAFANGRKNGTLRRARWSNYTGERNSPLTAPCDYTFLQGALIEQDKKCFLLNKQKQMVVPRGLADDDRLQILRLKNSAGKALTKMALMPVKGWQGDSDDFEKSLVNGDLVSMNSGRFIKLYNAETYGNASAAIPDSDQEEIDASAELGSGSADDSDNNNNIQKGYTLELLDKYAIPGLAKKVLKPNFLARYEEQVKAKIQQWDDVLWFPETEALCGLIARAMSPDPEALEFAWAGHSEFMTDEVKGILAKRKQIAGAKPKNTEPEDEDEEAALLGVDDDDEEDTKEKASSLLSDGIADQDGLDEDEDAEELDEGEEDHVAAATDDDDDFEDEDSGDDDDSDDEDDDDADDDEEFEDEDDSDDDEDDDSEDEEDSDDAEESDDGDDSADEEALAKAEKEMQKAMEAARARANRGKPAEAATAAKPKAKRTK